MSRKRVILAGIGALVLVAFALHTVFSKAPAMFETAGESLGGGVGSGTIAQRAAAPAAPAAPAPVMSDGGRAASGAASAVGGQAVQAQALPSLDRMIIRNVSMTVVVPNGVEAYRQIELIAAEEGGLVAGSQVKQEGERTVATVTLRVPAEGRAYQATLDRVRGLAERVLDEQGQTQDVSEEYVDLESRLRNLRATEKSLLGLYDRAGRLEDVFAVQREITNVRGQIEQAEGRKQALERRAAMATLTLQIREPATLPARQREWSPADVAGDALAALGRGLRGVTTAAIWLVV